MSYKFPAFVCDACGVVSFDPVDGKRDGETEPYPCRIMYADPVDETPRGIFAKDPPVTMTRCTGTVRPFAFLDSDMFVFLYRGD